MREIWKSIKGWEGLYEVSNLGNVKSLKYGKERILKPGKHKDGYLRINLSNNGRRKNFSIHRLVAEVFISNPYKLPEVNHKDENKLNNRVDNLEWCNRQYNVDYSLSMPINQYSKDGVFIKQWKSAREAERQLGVWQENINNCCIGNRKSAGGFKWFFVDDPTQYIDQPLF